MGLRTENLMNRIFLRVFEPTLFICTPPFSFSSQISFLPIITQPPLLDRRPQPPSPLPLARIPKPSNTSPYIGMWLGSPYTCSFLSLFFCENTRVLVLVPFFFVGGPRLSSLIHPPLCCLRFFLDFLTQPKPVPHTLSGHIPSFVFFTAEIRKASFPRTTLCPSHNGWLSGPYFPTF